jgi:hypothetical protein
VRPTRARVALTAVLALLSLAIVLTLLESPMSVARANKPAGIGEEPIAGTTRSNSYCQPHEHLPQGTTAIRVWLDAAAGPRVRLVVTAGGRTLTSGERGSGWSGGSVTVPVRPLSQAVSGVTVCVSFRLHDEAIIVQGNATPAALAAHDDRRALPGRMWIEYLRAGSQSWAALVPSIVRRMGFGRAEPGSWVAFLALGLLATVVVLAASAAFRELS